ncbi:hypothetical protein ABH927_000314 [Planotetraspora sp. GP83]
MEALAAADCREVVEETAKMGSTPRQVIPARL